MLGPFQRILVCSRSHCDRSNILLAASGSSIFSFDFSDGALTSVWPFSQTNTTPANFVAAQIVTQEEENSRSLEKQPDQDHPSKRRKVSIPPEGSDSTSAEILVEDGATITSNSNRTKASSIIKLIATSDGQHVVAVTGEDKCVRVFELLADGSLRQISERQMPKKPCALVLTTDESTILCADKFGDAYSLPLLGHPFPSDIKVSDATEQNPKQPVNAFVPAATSLTVHTRRNQQALKNQQKAETKAVQKRTLNFEHQLLLGHVSLLTDLTYVTVGSKGHPTAQTRSYILTSDRDEHIRISRGLPQAHIIEGYCLGHTEFVSRLCVLPWSRSLLVSGGGDGTLILWDWLNGTLKQRSDLRHDIETSKVSLRTNLNGRAVTETDAKGNNANIAVSGIWALQYKDKGSTITEKDIVITCEGTPSLFFYRLDSECTMRFRGSVSVGGNVIDVAVLEAKNTQTSIIYSMDNVHEPSSTTIVETGDAPGVRPYLGTLSQETSSDHWHVNEDIELVINRITRIARSEKSEEEATSDESALSELLYGIEHLRKRGQDE